MIKSLIRYKKNNRVCYGVLEKDIVIEIKGSIYDKYILTDKHSILSDIEILPPTDPSMIICFGYNYKDLIGYRQVYEEPIIFFKSPTSVISHNSTIKIPKNNQKVWIEVELAIIIKKKCKNISEVEAKNYILGHTIGNDITIENIHGRDHHLARSKGWDTFCSIGPTISCGIDTTNLYLKTKINGKIFQDSSTKHRILDDNKTIALISRFMTLNPGDIILTGTPANAENSVIHNGDNVELIVENIGTLKNTVSFVNES